MMPLAPPSIDWFYVNKGARVGPVDTAAMQNLFQRGDISGSTLVWNSSFGQQWKTLDETELRPIDEPPHSLLLTSTIASRGFSLLSRSLALLLRRC